MYSDQACNAIGKTAAIRNEEGNSAVQSLFVATFAFGPEVSKIQKIGKSHFYFVFHTPLILELGVTQI